MAKKTSASPCTMPTDAFNVEDTRKSRQRERRQRLHSQAIRMARLAKRLLRAARRREREAQELNASVDSPSKLAKPFDHIVRTYATGAHGEALMTALSDLVKAFAKGTPSWAADFSTAQKNTVENVANDMFSLLSDMRQSHNMKSDPYAEQKRIGFHSRAQDIGQRLGRIDNVLAKQASIGPTNGTFSIPISPTQESLLEIHFADSVHHEDIGLDTQERIQFAKAVAVGKTEKKLVLPADKDLLKHGIHAIQEVADTEEEIGNKADARALFELARRMEAYLR